MFHAEMLVYPISISLNIVTLDFGTPDSRPLALYASGWGLGLPGGFFSRSHVGARTPVP